jgi:hypothetical protein
MKLGSDLSLFQYMFTDLNLWDTKYITTWNLFINSFYLYIISAYQILILMYTYLFNIPGLWLNNAVIFIVSIPRLKYHEIFLEF